MRAVWLKEMQSAQEAREARRRKILARGADRLAYITGELPAVSSLPSSASASSSAPAADLPSSPNARSGDAALYRLSDASQFDQPGAHFSSGVEFDAKASTGVLKDVHQQLRALDQSLPQPRSQSTSKPTLSKLNEDVTLPGSEQTSDVKGNESIARVRVKQPLVTWYGLGRSVDFTENSRSLLALLLALFLVAQSFLSCNDLLGNFFSNLAPPWPLAFVIVTDISLVFGALLLGFVGTPLLAGETEVDEVYIAQDQLMQALNVANKLEFFLEVALVLLKASRALFLDCGIYIVVLTSGVSLAQIWRPTFCTLMNLN